jgi:hypothetical protein
VHKHKAAGEFKAKAVPVYNIASRVARPGDLEKASESLSRVLPREVCSPMVTSTSTTRRKVVTEEERQLHFKRQRRSKGKVNWASVRSAG